MMQSILCSIATEHTSGASLRSFALLSFIFLFRFIRKQCYPFWASENPKELNHQSHNAKVIVYFSIAENAEMKTGPRLFKENKKTSIMVTSQRYIDVLQDFF